MSDNPLKRPGTYVDDSPEQLLYEEHHSANGLVAILLFWIGVALLVGGIALASAHAGGASPIVIPLGIVLIVCAGSFLIALRPVGIRITTKRVIVGALAYADGRDVATVRRKDGTVPARRWVYTCGWEGVRSIVIATGTAEGKRLSQEARSDAYASQTGLVANPQSVPMGLLFIPGAKALLAIRVDPDLAEYPRARQKKSRYWLASPVLGAPTQHPEKLRQALASFPTADRITDEITYRKKRSSY